MTPGATKGNDMLPDQTLDTDITTTIIANRDGSVVSTVSEQKMSQNRQLPNSPKTKHNPPMNPQVPLEVTFN